MSGPRVLLRCDARPDQGLGHLVRCVAVAEAARAAGWSVTLTGAIEASSLAYALLAEAELDAQELAENGTGSVARLAALHGADVVHVDHYDLARDLRQELSHLGVLLSNVEDGEYGRRPADVVVDATPGAELRSRPDDGSPLLLRGLKFALLRESVGRARQARASRMAPVPEADLEILVLMGGSDVANALGRVTHHVLGALDESGKTARLTVVDSSAQQVRVEGHGTSSVRWVPPVPDLPGLAASFDFVVTAAGTTMWELMTVAVPMAVVCVADNQQAGYTAVVGPGTAIGLGVPDALTGREALSEAFAQPATSRRSAAHDRALMDGRGAHRLVAKWGEMLTSPRWRSRPATTHDADLLLSWRNDEVTRRWSRDTAEVAPEEHRVWLRDSLDRADRRLLVVEVDGVPAGTVRWDRLDELDWEVSVTMAPASRGLGAGQPLLRAGEGWLRAWVGGSARAVALVLPENLASARLFARCGYERAHDLDRPPFQAHRRWLESSGEPVPTSEGERR